MNIAGAVVFCSIQPCAERTVGDLQDDSTGTMYAVCDMHLSHLDRLMRSCDDPSSLLRWFLSSDSADVQYRVDTIGP